MKTQKGFGIIEGLLILVILGLVGGVGYYAWKVNKDSEKNLDSISTSKVSTSEKKTEKAADPTKDWKAYSSKEGQYSLKYPTTWVTADSPELCTEGLLLLGGNKSSVGGCATDGGGQMTVVSEKGDVRSNMEMDPDYYADLKTEQVTVAGVTGKKQTGTFKVPEGMDGPGPQNGEKHTVYTFFTNSRTYRASYGDGPGFPDVLADFNTMVSKTLKFEA